MNPGIPLKEVRAKVRLKPGTSSVRKSRRIGAEVPRDVAGRVRGPEELAQRLGAVLRLPRELRTHGRERSRRWALGLPKRMSWVKIGI